MGGCPKPRDLDQVLIPTSLCALDKKFIGASVFIHSFIKC